MRRCVSTGGRSSESRSSVSNDTDSTLAYDIPDNHLPGSIEQQLGNNLFLLFFLLISISKLFF